MAFLSKDSLLVIYKQLSTLSPDPTVQGATQKVSAIRYFLALDMFYKQFNRECNTANHADTSAFVSFVGKVVSINGSLYTSNFYNSLNDEPKYSVGSNFFSVGVVNTSRSNGGTKLNYPRRGGGLSPLISIQNGSLFEDPGLIANFSTYVSSIEHKTALALWILRDVNLNESSLYSSVFAELGSLFTTPVISILLPSQTDFENYCNQIHLKYDTVTPTLTREDILGGKKNIKSMVSTQRIYFGAPGTGKSTTADVEAKALVSNPDEFIIRTVFHPASDYSTFVGCYKPIKKDTPSTVAIVAPYSQQQNTMAPSSKIDPEWYSIDAPLFGPATGPTQAPMKTSHIDYEFEPQAFLLAYMKALEFPNEKIVLIIEEINRANCAQVFGDIFQLLDRNASYGITPNTAIVNFLKKEGKERGNEFLFISQSNKISLPDNLYLFATMNTSDQSLFPMDSAFIRRWERRYIKIDYAAQIKNNSGAYAWKLSDVKIVYNDTSLVSQDTKYSEASPTWDTFLRAINWHISKSSQSEDKMMGEFFIKLPDAAGNPEISEDIFVNSVMSYLWDEVCKDLPPKSRFFKFYKSDNEPEVFSYSDYFELESDSKSLLIARFIHYILKHYEDEAKEKCVSEIIGKEAKALASASATPVAPSTGATPAAAVPSTTNTPSTPTI